MRPSERGPPSPDKGRDAAEYPARVTASAAPRHGIQAANRDGCGCLQTCRTHPAQDGGRLSGTRIATVSLVRSNVPIVLFALQAVLATSATASDPFTFFRPSVVVSVDDRRSLDQGQPVARVVPGKDSEVAVFAAVPVDVDGDRLVAWMRHIADLKKSPYVLAIGRFSDPPRIEDLEGLTLDDEDLLEIRQCQPRRCGLKLTGAEMNRLRRTLADAGSDWKPALQDAFRHLVLERVQTYLADGGAGLPAFEDKGEPVSSQASFSSVVRQSEFLAERLPRFAEYLDQYPRAPMPGVESFIYWSKERLGAKPIISATHVGIVRGDGVLAPDVLVAGKGIFATHYVNASLGLTALMRGEPGAHNYLVYINRSAVDVVRGFFGGLVRWFMERRLKKEASGALTGLRRRLESGDPDRTGRR